MLTDCNQASRCVLDYSLSAQTLKNWDVQILPVIKGLHDFDNQLSKERKFPLCSQGWCDQPLSFCLAFLLQQWEIKSSSKKPKKEREKRRKVNRGQPRSTTLLNRSEQTSKQFPVVFASISVQWKSSDRPRGGKTSLQFLLL